MQLKDEIVNDHSNFEKTNTPAEETVLLDERATSEQLCIDGGCRKSFGREEISHQVLDIGEADKAGFAGSPSFKHVMQPSSRDSSVRKTNIPVERSVPLDERESSEQIHVDIKEPFGSPKPIGSQNWPFHVLDVGKGEIYPVAGSSSSKHVRQPSSRDSSIKRVETGKVKFLSAEEVPFLRSGIQVSRKWGSLGPGPHRIDQENIKSHPILPRKPISMSTLANSKESKVLHQPNKGFDYTDEMLTTATEIQRNKSSVLFQEKSVGGSVGIDIDEGKSTIDTVSFGDLIELRKSSNMSFKR